MSFSNICKFLDRFIPTTASRLYIEEVPVHISTSDHPIFTHINEIPVGVYFQVDGEIWIIHPLQSFKEIVTPFLLPLRYQFCADYHLILCSVKQYEKYPDRITEIWRKYGYGVIVIDQHSDPPVKLLDYPLTQYMFPEVRRQVHDYLKEKKNIQFFREPFWIKANESSNCYFSPAPELLEIVKTINEKSTPSVTHVKNENKEYEDIISRLKNSNRVSLPERQWLTLYLFREIEILLKEKNQINNTTMSIEKIINDSYQKGHFTKQVKDFLHNVRMRRNKFAHSTPEEDYFLPEVLLALDKMYNGFTSTSVDNNIKEPLSKKLLKTLPKQGSDKLPYGTMRKELEKKPSRPLTDTYNPFLNSIMKKFLITNAINPKILAVLLMDKFTGDIDGTKLMIEVEACCKENDPDRTNYPLLSMLAD